MNKSDFQNDPIASEPLTKMQASQRLSNCCNARIKEPEITFWSGPPGSRPSPTCMQCGSNILLQPVKKDLMKALQEKPKTMNKSACCNAEVKTNGATSCFVCTKCKKTLIPFRHANLPTLKTKPIKPKVTKYYEVKYTIDNFEHYTVLIANNPIDAQKKFESSNYQAIVKHIKLLEIIQEDTNQDL